MLDFLFNRSSQARATESPAKSEQPNKTKHEVIFRLRADSAPAIEILENQFMAMLLDGSCNPDGELTPNEAQVLEWLAKLNSLESFPGNMVPRLPQVIPRLLAALRDEDSSAESLVNLITEDLTLVAEVIRLSNSAYYRTGEKIESLKQAVIKLGTNGVRQLVSSALFKPILSSGRPGLTRVLGQYLWEKNQKAALAGNYIALHTGDDRFYAYLAGLLSQSGLIIATKAFDGPGASISSPYSARFLAEVDSLSQQLSLTLSRQWEMPVEVTDVLNEKMKFDKDTGMSSLANACYVADRLAKISLLDFKGSLQGVDEGFTCHIGTIRSQQCQICYNFINLEELRDREQDH